ncbi:hypothetical protein PUMCH_000014 [Australozyma saopauloensis]|uniref:CWF19-like protein DRN1 n=1 Tax=Australozyma saopauloensis TaxID=291208 RepID=A0AAX4H2M6_9ASCO|nr:hypothetical protein PUMCH_000014 [[Candida] saopauloensis]
MDVLKPKFLVLHPDPDTLNDVVKKINTQNSKIGPLAAVILLGSLPDVKIENELDVPTYFIKSNNSQSEQETSKNLIGVKAPSVTKLPCGVTMAFVDTQSKDIKAIADYAGTADLMFTYHWPQAIAATERLTLVGNRTLDPIVQSLRPRYHFAVGSDKGRHFEYPAFAWDNERICRFISLGREKTGTKWFYAFGLGNEKDNVSGCCTNPFLVEPKPELSPIVTELVDTKEQKLQRLKRHTEEESEAREPEVKRPRVTPDTCFFCLLNPKVETHMIVSIGRCSYLTIAKGPLTLPLRNLNLSGHAILVPLDHTPTASLPTETSEELQKYQSSIAAAFHLKGFAVVFFEISRPENVHYHIQMVPIPENLLAEHFDRALQNRLQVNNEKFANNQNLEFTKCLPDDGKMEDLTKNSFVRFTLFENLMLLRYYVAPVIDDKTLDLQFPRRVLAFLLKTPKRQNWDRCRQTLAEESNECEKFKNFYQPFDFTHD